MPCHFQAGAEQQLRARCGALRPVSPGPRQPPAAARCTEASCPAPTLDPRSPPPAGVHRRPRCPHSKAGVPTTPAAVTLVTNHGPAPASAGQSASRRAAQQHRLLQGRRPSPGWPEPHAGQHLEEATREWTTSRKGRAATPWVPHRASDPVRGMADPAPRASDLARRPANPPEMLEVGHAEKG